MGKIILRHLPQPSSWSPLDIPDIDGYIDPRLGVTLGAGSKITSIVEQVNTISMSCNFTNPDGLEGAAVGDNTPWRPTLQTNAFGTLPGIKCDPNRVFTKAQFVRMPTTRHLVNGMSFLFVCKFTENRTVANHGAENIPNTVTGESSHDSWNTVGFAGTSLSHNYFDVSPIGWQRPTFGSGFNDNVARLFATTHSLIGEVKAYANVVQIGSTVTGADYSTLNFSWSGIGTGYAADATPDIYGGDDGFKGLIGPVVVVNGVISGSDMAQFYAWCQSEGWLP